MADEHPSQFDGARRLRRMNETIRARIDEFRGGPPPRYVVMCECPAPGCAEMLEIERSAYQAIREEPGWYVVASEHVDDRLMRLVREDGGLAIIEFPSLLD
jgi:hypothetical protein